MEEVWKDIEGYEGLYQVSNLGRVKSLERVASEGKRGQRIICEKIKHPKPNKKGYLKVMLSKNNKQNGHFVHRLVGNAFINNPLSKPQINHIDGNVTNNCVDNLEWCTQSENIKHAFANLGRQTATKGKQLPPEWRRKISEGNKGKSRAKRRIVSEETRQKLRDMNWGRKPSEETRKRLSESHKGKSFPRKNNKLITYNGKTQTLQSWAKELNIPRERLTMRLRRGWTIERALTEEKVIPNGRRKKEDVYAGI